MTIKIILQLLLLPIVMIGVPLMLGTAWLQEALEDRRLRRQVA